MDHAEDAKDVSEFLPVGTKLLNGTYEITSHLGAGGFGLTYLADDQIGRKVVIKECFPASFCHRDGLAVRAQTKPQQENFEKLIKNFVNEARQLAKLKHPNVVPVLHFFEENDTAYMSLEYIKGDDLAQRVQAGGEPMRPERIIDIANGMLRALDYIHSRGILHRDIAPDNVIMNDADQPVLIDFGASRNETAQAVTRLLSQQLRAVKDGYSPQEFYMPGRQHTPASDLYSLAATIYTMITGRIPADAYNRLVELSKKEPDPLRPLSANVEGYPRPFLEAMDKALSLLPADRPQSAEEMRLLMLPKSEKVTPISRRPSEPTSITTSGRDAGDTVAPKRPTREPRPGQSRPPAVDTSPVSQDVSKLGFDPSNPPRTVTPRVVRSNELPRPGTAVHAPSVSQSASEPSSQVKRQATVPPLAPSEPVESKGATAPVSAPLPDPAPSSGGFVLRVAAVVNLVVAAAVAYAVFGNGFGNLIGSDADVAVETPASISAVAGDAVALADDLPGEVAVEETALLVDTETAEPATAESDTVTAALEDTTPPTPTVTEVAPEIVATQSAVHPTGWEVTLDLPLIANGDAVTFAPGEGSPYPSGTILARVGDESAGSDPSAIAALAAAYFATSDPKDPRLPVRVRNPIFDSQADAQLAVRVERKVDFGAFTLTQRASGLRWAIAVAEADDSTGLQPGDVILSERNSGLNVDRIVELEAVFDGFQRRGRPEAVLIVQRNGIAQSVTIDTAFVMTTGGAG